MGRARISLSAASAVATGVLAAAYLRPYEFVRRAPDAYSEPQPKGLVSYIEQLTIIPVWPVAFGIASIMLVLCIIGFRGYLKYAHLAAGAILVGYSSALWITAIAAPGTYIVSAVFSAFAAVANLALCDSYAGRPPK